MRFNTRLGIYFALNGLVTQQRAEESSTHITRCQNYIFASNACQRLNKMYVREKKKIKHEQKEYQRLIESEKERFKKE